MERDFNPALDTFVNGGRPFRCHNIDGVVITAAPLKNIWQVRLAPIPDDELRSFTTETDVIIKGIQEFGVESLRNWDFSLAFPSGDQAQWDIRSSYQVKIGTLAVVRSIYWQDVFLPKDTTVTINGSSNDSGFFITGEPVFMASYHSIESNAD